MRSDLAMACKRTLMRGVVLIVFVSAVVSTPPPGDKPSEKHKRQIFREQVLPHAGGKIPDSAFHTDRLALNRLNKDGIAIPDGVLLDARPHDKHPHVMPNSDLEMAVIKIVLTPDGRYVPREGASRDLSPRTVDSTYIIRPPIGSYKHEYRRYPKQKYHQPIPSKLELPNKEVTRPSANRIIPSIDLSSLGTNQIDLGPNFNFGFSSKYAFQSTQGFFSEYMLPFYTPQSISSFDYQLNNDFSISNGGLLRAPPVRKRNRNRVRFPSVTQPEASYASTRAPKLAPNNQSPLPGADAYALYPGIEFTCGVLASFQEDSFADLKTACQSFHVCRKDGQHSTYECPKGTLFSEAVGRCDWWYNVKCS